MHLYAQCHAKHTQAGPYAGLCLLVDIRTHPRRHLRPCPHSHSHPHPHMHAHVRVHDHSQPHTYIQPHNYIHSEMVIWGAPLAQCGRSATIWASSRTGDPYFVTLGASLLPLP